MPPDAGTPSASITPAAVDSLLFVGSSIVHLRSRKSPLERYCIRSSGALKDSRKYLLFYKTELKLFGKRVLLHATGKLIVKTIERLIR